MNSAPIISADIIHPFTSRDVPWLVNQRAETTPEQPFLVWESFTDNDASWTYRAFRNDVETVAANLALAGVSPGDYLLLHLDNCPEFLLTWFACARLGAIAVTTNTRCPADEVSYFAVHSKAQYAVTQPRYAEMIRDCMPATAPLYVLASDPGENRPLTHHRDGRQHFDQLLEPAKSLPERTADCNLPVSVQYTSGTTSRPKGVVWTHANALWAAKVNAEHAAIGPEDSTPVFLPLFHTNAIGYSTLATLWSGGTIVLQPKFSASRFWDISTRHRCTWANMIAFTIQALLHQQAPQQHCYRFWACASDVKAIKDKWGIKTLGWWGMTETVSQGIVADHGWLNPEMSMGRAVPEYPIKVCDEQKNPVAPGATGKLYIRGVRGLSLFLEYLNDPEATARAFTDDGWLDTGDLVTLTPNGDLFFVEREKDMLKIGGENVATSEIERVLISLPGVLEAAVIGTPDAMLDEVAVAFVVAETDLHEASLIGQCAEQLADFKVPRKIIFLDALPKGTLDKVLKKELREMLNTQDANA